jgi:predicted amidophosphoribosyltransferase
MLRDNQMVCDVCQKPITRVTQIPAEGWPKMHNLCSTCFSELKRQAIPRPT